MPRMPYDDVPDPDYDVPDEEERAMVLAWIEKECADDILLIGQALVSGQLPDEACSRLWGLRKMMTELQQEATIALQAGQAG